ncbi:MFS transporter [Streptomyces zagrosensis]|uniref:alpha-amylase n=1 Tax=Streptomyces zagrosensis TaxID=1042984 RepID=A0A7W9Q623_9ACTN|nr:MFS transporter [Streptomyces zagrosensis]MBB5934286.1 EmrB/QacA subfamily drug resistance transporter [Streptomyces zagrosensis]
MATTTPPGVRGDAGLSAGAENAAAGAAPATPAGPMTHRQIMEALSGLLLGMFVAILSSTIVTNALPEIISDLHGSQSSYTWVVTAALLAMTASTPLWGKLSDLFSKKLLVQISLIIYVAGSVVAGLSQNTSMLIGCRVVQGIGVGGLTALAQIVMAAMISPRERGRYSGYLGATFAVATVGGPLLGGVITDTSWLGWRWCFYVGVPFAIVALVVLQKTLRLPVVKREVKVDWTGAFFVSAAVSLLLVWVTLAGDNYDWISWQSYAMVGGAFALGLIFVWVESRAAEPIIPLRLFRNRTITLASIASLFVGVAMFTGTVFFSQYFQLARGESPTMSGVMTIPMIMGLFVSSTVSGQIITKNGRWKAWLVSGGALLTAGMAMLGTLRYDTPYWQMAVYMVLMGLGIGMMMQNLVLCTQNQVAPRDLGAASSVVTFFRSLGGAIGVSALGAVLAHQVKDYTKDGFTELAARTGGKAPASLSGGGGIPDLDKLPAPIRTIVESAYGHGVGDIFLYAAPSALLAFLVTIFIKEVALQTKVAGHESKPANPAEAVAHEAPADAANRTADAEGTLVLAAVGAATGTPDDGAAGQGGAEGSARRPKHALSGSGARTASWGGGDPLAAATAINSAVAPGPDETAVALGAAGVPQSDRAVDQQPIAGYGAAHRDGVGTGTGTGTGEVGGVPIHGRIRNADGGAVPHSAVTLISLSGRQLGRSATQQDGSYALQAPGAGSYVLIAAADGHQPQASTVVIGQEPLGFDVLLTGTSGLAGAVRSATDGLPVEAAMVVVTDVRGEVLATAKTGPQGDFAFDELVPGTFTLAVGATGYRPCALPVEIGSQGVTRIEVELRSGARVQGTIRAGADHRPLPDARVTLVDAAGNVAATTSTGEDGAYAFTDLDTGDYTVIASGYPPVATALPVHGPGVDGYDITLVHPDDQHGSDQHGR